MSEQRTLTAAVHQEQGRSIKATDGHLHVLDSSNHVVAIYAPDNWKSADDDGAQEN
ncbi:hypothetical protein [Lentzea sp. E54]|uniref:hypothetical protein n=1 Tax=Lentzea xerophila TaxID=3435883 RepID=UPI003DA5BF77